LFNSWFDHKLKFQAINFFFLKDKNLQYKKFNNKEKLAQDEVFKIKKKKKKNRLKKTKNLKKI
jgi:hypothetical protein